MDFVATSMSATDASVQSEEARLEFDKEPGHDKLKVSMLCTHREVKLLI